MKQRIKKCRWSFLLILAAAFMMTLATAFAQNAVNMLSSYAQADIKENPDTIMSRMNAANTGVENKDVDLLDELLQSDSSEQTERKDKDESCDINECTLATPR